MSAGLIIYNDAGKIQIDENYRNLLVQNSGTNGTPAASGITYPLCALQCPDFAVAYTFTKTSSVSYTVQKAGAGSHKWWVYDLSSTPAGSAGLQVYNAAGALVYDSLRKAMKVVDYKKWTTNAWVGQAYTYPAGRSYAVVIGTYASRSTRERLSSGVDGYEIQEIQYYGGAKVVGNVVTLDWINVRDETFLDANPAQYETERPAMDMLVVDVTNY